MDKFIGSNKLHMYWVTTGMMEALHSDNQGHVRVKWGSYMVKGSMEYVKGSWVMTEWL